MIDFFSKSLTLLVYDLHIHSNYSDGSATIDEIAKKCRQLKLKAIGIVDHSIDKPFGLTEKKAKMRQEEIDEAVANYGLKIYSGIECGIDYAGNIMLPDYDFDFIVASVHEFVDGKKYYERVIKCFENFQIDVAGHLFSSLFGFTVHHRELDKKLLDVIESQDIAIELNSSHKSPPDQFLKMIRNREVRYSIGSDAHVLAKVGSIGWCIKKAKKYMKRAKLFLP